MEKRKIQTWDEELLSAFSFRVEKEKNENYTNVNLVHRKKIRYSLNVLK